MEKREKLGHIYKIAMTIYPIIIGLFSITTTWSIYFANQGSEVVFNDKDINPILIAILVMVLLYVGMIIASIWLIKDKDERRLSTSLHHQWRKHASTIKDAPGYQKSKRQMIILSSICGAIILLSLLMATIFFFAFDFDGSKSYVEQSIVILSHVLPWVFLVFIAYTVWKFLFEYKLITLLSQSKAGTGKHPSEHLLTKNILRGVILVMAMTFIVIGIAGKGYQDVLSKASKICLECLGIG